MMINFYGKSAAVTVPAASLTEVAKIYPNGWALLCFHFNVAAQALDNFDILVKAHPDATARDITPANWAALVLGDRFVYASADLAAVAAAGNGYYEMDVTGLHEVSILASGAADSASVASFWSLSH